MNLAKRFLYLAFSVKTGIVIAIILSFSMAVGTFIENDFGIETALSIVYKSKWFEILWVLFILNLTGGILYYRLWKKPYILLIHASFIIIFIGAVLTRYAGYEGTIHLREGEVKDYILSYDPYLQFKIKAEGEVVNYQKKIFISALGGNYFSKSFNIKGERLDIKLVDFIPVVDIDLVEKTGGMSIVLLKIKKKGEDFKRYILKDQGSLKLGKIRLYFNEKPSEKDPYIHIYSKDGNFYIGSKYPFLVSDKKEGTKKMTGYLIFEKEKLYAVGGVLISLENMILSGDLIVKPVFKSIRGDDDLSSLVFKINYRGDERYMYLLGRGLSYKGITEKIKIDNVEIEGVWGSKEIKLPFYLYLKDFVLKRYPGSDKASSYESHVVLIDEKEGVEVPYVIYMNNPLKYKGYRIFQTSYDKDEKGSVLSVNYDPGTMPTYTGYAVLFLGLVLNLLKRRI